MYDFQQALAVGMYEPQTRVRRQMLIDRVKRKQRDPWKEREYEAYWGEKLEDRYAIPSDNRKRVEQEWLQTKKKPRPLTTEMETLNFGQDPAKSDEGAKAADEGNGAEVLNIDKLANKKVFPPKTPNQASSSSKALFGSGDGGGEAETPPPYLPFSNFGLSSPTEGAEGSCSQQRTSPSAMKRTGSEMETMKAKRVRFASDLKTPAPPPNLFVETMESDNPTDEVPIFYEHVYTFRSSTPNYVLHLKKYDAKRARDIIMGISQKEGGSHKGIQRDLSRRQKRRIRVRSRRGELNSALSAGQMDLDREDDLEADDSSDLHLEQSSPRAHLVEPRTAQVLPATQFLPQQPVKPPPAKRQPQFRTRKPRAPVAEPIDRNIQLISDEIDIGAEENLGAMEQALHSPTAVVEDPEPGLEDFRIPPQSATLLGLHAPEEIEGVEIPVEIPQN